MKATLLFLAACSSTPAPRAPAPALECTRVDDWSPTRSFLQSDHVVFLRTLQSTFGPISDGSRCVDVELEVKETLRGNTPRDTRVRVVVQQSTLENATARPAGAWWSVEQNLVAGSSYIAFCPTGELATTLRGSCRVLGSSVALPGARFAQGVEAAHLAWAAALKKLRNHCADTSEIEGAYVVEKYGLTDHDVLTALVALMREPECDRRLRYSLRDRMLATLDSQPAPAAHLIIRGLFALLSIYEPIGVHDNLLQTWIPKAIVNRTASDVFANHAAALEAATTALASYTGRVDISNLRAWLTGKQSDAAARSRPR